MKPLLRFFACMAAIMLLTACFDYREEYWIEKDGSARLKLNIGFGKELLSMAEESKHEDTPGLKGRFENLSREIHQRPGVTSCELTEADREGIHYYTFDVKVDSVDALNGLQQAIMAESDAPGEGKKKDQPRTAFAAEGSNFTFTHAMGKKGTGEASGTGSGEISFGSAFEGRTYAVILHAPKIIEGNGEPSDGGTTMTWSKPMGEIMDAGNSYREFSAEFKTGGLPWWLWIIAVFLAIDLVFVLAFMFLRSGRS